MNPSPKPSDAGEQTIFDAARQIPDAQARAAYLETACGGDASLRERVERLLHASKRADAFLAADPLGLGAVGRQTILETPLSESPGTIIGNYKLLEKLGEGGFGVVYMAEQKQPIKRRVALKIIKVGMDTREVVARFEAERQALALMDHPNIAKVFDAGATEAPLPASGHPLPSTDEGRGQGEESTQATRHSSLVTSAGRPYFVMELVRGIKITDYCDEKNLSTGERLHLFTQVCQAVQHAHQKGIIHRDLKPSNILVTVNDGVAVPKIIDFGIAKATQLELTEKTVFTRFHQFLGTPAYMSPEQTELTSVDIDTRSDIYSLGVLLYELLTGQTPFDTHELLKAGLDEMRRTIREVEPVKPSTRLTEELSRFGLGRRKVGKWESEKVGSAATSGDESHSPTHPLTHSPTHPPAHFRPASQPSTLNPQHLKELIPALRGDLDWIVMKCLEKDRARRYETANGLASDIQRHLNNEPVVACPPSNLYKFQKLVRRNKLAFAAGAGIAAALVIGLGIALWQSVERTRAYNRAVAAEMAAQTEAAKSRQVAQYLKDLLQDLGPSVALVHDPAMVRGVLDRAVERIDRDLANQPETAIELRTTVAAIYGELGLYDRMETVARTNLVLARATFGEEDLSVASALSQLGQALVFRGKEDQAEPLTREVLRIRRKLLGNDHLDVARSLCRLGHTLRNRAPLAEVEDVYNRGLAICAKLGQPSIVEADLFLSLGLALKDGRPEEAEQNCLRSLAIRRQLVGNEHPAVCEVFLVLGLVLAEQGKVAEAERIYQEAVTLSRKLFGADHPWVARALRGLGTTFADQGRFVEAQSLLSDAVAIQRKVFGNDDRDLTYTLRDLGTLLERQGRWADAEICYAEVLAVSRKLSVNPRGQLLLRLASVLRKQGKPAEADALLREAMAAFRNQAEMGELDANNAIAWLLATHPNPAVRDGGAAVTYAQKAVAATTRRSAKYLDTLAAAYAEAGDFAKAIAVEKEAISLLSTEAEKQDCASRLKLYESGSPYRERE